jgi:hypothetical protein
MSYYRFAEIAIALSFGLTFALVGWWDIVGMPTSIAGGMIGNDARTAQPWRPRSPRSCS